MAMLTDDSGNVVIMCRFFFGEEKPKIYIVTFEPERLYVTGITCKFLQGMILK
jgi:hypothetical protein